MSITRTYRILISNNSTATAGTTVAGLGAGEIAFLAADGSFVAAGETITDSATLTPVMGMAAGNLPKYAPKVQGVNVVRYEGSSYSPAVEQISYIGDNSSIGNMETPVVGTSYSMHIVIMVDPGLWSERQLRRSYEVVAATVVTADLVAQFVAVITADKEAAKYVTAAAEIGGGNDGIEFTAVAQAYNSLDVPQFVSFKLALDLGFTNATPIDQFGYIYVNGAVGTTTGSASVVADQGSGTYPLVANMEEFAIGYDGALNRTGFPIPDAPRMALLGTTYDVYSIASDDVHASSSLNGEIAAPVQVIIAVPAGSANQIAIEAILDPYMISTPKAFAALNL